jgi:hypothetical protein
LLERDNDLADTGGWHDSPFDPVYNTGGWAEWQGFDTKKTTLLKRLWGKWMRLFSVARCHGGRQPANPSRTGQGLRLCPVRVFFEVLACSRAGAE